MSGEDAAAIACSLSAVELRDRTAAWRAISTSALRTKVALSHGVRLTFRPDHMTAHSLLDLIAAERDCCAWASWSLTTTNDATLVEATADRPGAATLQAMFEVTP